MNPRLIIFIFAALAVVAQAQETAAVRLPMPPVGSSPVALFRLLLTTNDTGREQFLATRTVEQRRYLEGKISEFTELTVDERERRLQVLQLRWYLPQLMRMTPAERTARLALIPEPDRKLIKSKLDRFTIMPPTMQKDLLENQQAIALVASAGQHLASKGPLSPEMEQRVQRLNSLPAEKREQIYANYDRFFDLPGAEQSKALQRLTASERAQMERTLTTFANLPPGERAQAVAGFRKFAELSPLDRAAFLKTAERWQAMTETERENWRKLVERFRSAVTAPLPPMPSAGKQSTTALAGARAE